MNPVPALYIALLLAIILIAFYLHIIIPFMGFPADLLMWGETDFIGNIIRLRGDYPMYSPVADINSSTYPPLAAITTYSLAQLLRLPLEVPVLRYLQLFYVVLAVAAGYVSWRMLRVQLIGNRPSQHHLLWSLLVIMVLFLTATSPETGRYVFVLHTDALSLCWSMCSFAVLIWYLERPSLARLLLLSLTPAIGFAIKQYLLIWAPIAFFTLLLDKPRKLGRLVLLTLITTAFTFLGVFIAWLFWGADYIFWVFEVIGGARSRIGFSAGGFEMSVPRAIDHLLQAWAPLSLGFVGGWLLLNRLPNRRALALWLPWLLLLTAEALTSGTGWGALYHFGPGAMIGAVWLLVILPELWPETRSSELHPLLRSAWALVAILAVYLALGAVPSGNEDHQRYWKRSLPEGAARYTAAIEAEFEGFSPDEVLIGWGNWIYLKDNHLARDRAISVADFPTVGRYNLVEPLLTRIREKRYRKILLHYYESPWFVYDWGLLDQPTGVRAALQENYRLLHTIEGLPGQEHPPTIQFGGDVSVLVPKESYSDGGAPTSSEE